MKRIFQWEFNVVNGSAQLRRADLVVNTQTKLLVGISIRNVWRLHVADGSPRSLLYALWP